MMKNQKWVTLLINRDETHLSHSEQFNDVDIQFLMSVISTVNVRAKEFKIYLSLTYKG